MKRKTKIFWVTWILIIVTLALIVTLNQNFLVSFINQYIESYGLPSVFLLSMLTDSFDQPIGPEVPAGFAVGFGLNPLYVLIFSIFGSVGILISLSFCVTLFLVIVAVLISSKLLRNCSNAEEGRHLMSMILYNYIPQLEKFFDS